MSIIPIVSAREMVIVLLKAGLKIIRQKGSHIRLHHPLTNKSTTVAMHAGDLTRKVIKHILSQSGISNRGFVELIKK
ncbi:MAG: type II toxin-antitoxin system HicA family toxin [Patescibacteria group bacterium]